MERLIKAIDSAIQSVFKSMEGDMGTADDLVPIVSDDQAHARMMRELAHYPEILEAYQSWVMPFVENGEVEPAILYNILLRLRRYVRNIPEHEKRPFVPVPASHFKGDKSRSVKHAPRRRRSSA